MLYIVLKSETISIPNLQLHIPLVTCCGAKAIAVEIRQKKAAIDFMVT